MNQKVNDGPGKKTFCTSNGYSYWPWLYIKFGIALERKACFLFLLLITTYFYQNLKTILKITFVDMYF